LTNLKTKENWYWKKTQIQAHKGLFSTPIYLKLYHLIYLSAGIVLLSFATSLYTKIVTLLSPVILYYLGKGLS
jgi:hypothetical protein